MQQVIEFDSFGVNLFCLDKARLDQVDDICNLINLSYRGQIGWTRETHIIQGKRTNHSEITAAIVHPRAHFFVVNHSNILIACVYVIEEQGSAYIGFFSVHPSLQAKGLGKHVLKLAEVFALEKLDVRKYVMFVVSQRPELIAFYERRGYRRTGKIGACPADLGKPIISGLTVEYLEKLV